VSDGGQDPPGAARPGSSPPSGGSWTPPGWSGPPNGSGWGPDQGGQPPAGQSWPPPGRQWPTPPPQWPAPTPPPPPRPPRRGAVIALAVVLVLLATGGGIVAARNGEQSGADDTRLTSPTPTSAPPPSSTAPPQSSSRIAKAVAGVQDRLEEVRELRFRRSVPVKLLTPGKLAAQLLRELDAETDERALARQGRALELLGELRPGTDLPKLIRSVQAESVLGFYVPGKPPAKGRLYVRSDRGLDPYAEFVLSHELTHAVTDQHYDLTLSDRLEKGGKDDQVTAYSGLVEGDAVLTMQRYLNLKLTSRQQLEVAQAAQGERTPKLDAAPAVLRESLLFPYQSGLTFVNTLYQRGGYAAVDRAYRDPPTSTEQVIHPERYLQRDQPQAVDVPDLAGRLGAGWRPAATVEWGEFDSRLLLEGELPNTTAELAASGWDGGRLRTFERGGRTALVLRTVWDSAREARQYCDATGRWASSRFGRGAAANRWAGNGQQTALVCQGTHVAWLSGPDSATLDRLRAALGPP
jgi:hypothetical protein